ncbi:hypothetical protein, partial [Candidatus Cardinium sp. cBcalN1]|uniref:hypothetical protein n=1 Tax=Candidatus Cardinium sp. cBcalN1 TaxID=2699437 RepID=UPI001FB3828A
MSQASVRAMRAESGSIFRLIFNRFHPSDGLCHISFPHWAIGIFRELSLSDFSHTGRPIHYSRYGESEKE